jgi:hypothetical protein
MKLLLNYAEKLMSMKGGYNSKEPSTTTSTGLPPNRKKNLSNTSNTKWIHKALAGYVDTRQHTGLMF